MTDFKDFIQNDLNAATKNQPAAENQPAGNNEGGDDTNNQAE